MPSRHDSTPAPAYRRRALLLALAPLAAAGASGCATRFAAPAPASAQNLATWPACSNAPASDHWTTKNLRPR